MTTSAPVARPVEAGPHDDRGRYAPWSRRVIAWLLDAAIISTVSFLGGHGFGTTLGWIPWPGSNGDVPAASPWSVGVVVVIVALQAWTGQTPGKRAVGIAVVRESDGRPLGLLVTVAREVLHLLDAIFLVGFLRPLWHRRRRTFADSLVHSDVLHPAQVVPLRWVARLRGDRERALVQPRVVTVAAVAVCVVGVAALVVGRGAVGTTTWGCVGGVSGMPPTQPSLVHAGLLSDSWDWERRLGVTRRLDFEPASITWQYAGPVTALTARLGPSDAPVEVRVDLATGTATVDGQDVQVAISDGPADDSGYVDSDLATAMSSATVRLPESVHLAQADEASWSAAVEPTVGSAASCTFSG